MELNEEQALAVKHQGSPLLVLAGAGSGKTRVLTYRAKYLIDELGVKPEKIILLTFTNKAAEEIKKRVGENSRLGFAGTFHTFCARMLRVYGHRVGIPANFGIYDISDQEAAIKRAVKELELDPKTNRPGMFLHLISRYKNELISPVEFEILARDEFNQKLLSVWRAYDKILTAAKALDFDDLLLKTVELLQKPEMQEVIKSKYDYVLVDEYQDTNKAQFELTKLLAVNPDGLMVVGDAAQAIYSFRGADYRNLDLLQKEFPSLTTIKLPRNYRSTQKILDAAYGVIVNNTNHPVLKLEADNESGDDIMLMETLDEKEEAAYITGVIEKRIKNGGDVAVLYRTNAQSRAIEEALIRRGVDYRLVGGTRFYDRAEIKDLLAYLRVVVNREDLVSWDRVEKSGGKRNRAVFETWLAKEVEGLTGLPPQELLSRLMEQTNYLGRFDEKDEEDAARVENIRELLAVASEFDQVVEFLENVALITSEEIADRKKGETKVTLMTIHAAKGLEFDEVILAGLEEGLLPHSRSLMERADVEEERRLMYVAMTRARKKLHLTFTRYRLVYGGRSPSSPSRFLAEIPEYLLTTPLEKTSYRDSNPLLISPFAGGGNESRIVQDWEVEDLPLVKPSREQVEAELKDDFEEIDAW